MGAQHTPGPWSLSNGNLIRVNGPSLTEGWRRPVVVCGVHRIGKCRTGPDADKLALANGTLIAAAPDLLEALEDAVERLAVCARLTGNAEWAIDAMLTKHRAAIAKATGDA